MALVPRISFSPDFININSVNFQNEEKNVNVNVTLTDPIISPSGQDIGLTIKFTSSIDGITIPDVVWVAGTSGLPAPINFTLSNKARYSGNLNDIITTTIVTNSELYQNYVPKFKVNYKGSTMFSLFTNNSMVYHKAGSVSSGIGSVRNSRVKKRLT